MSGFGRSTWLPRRLSAFGIGLGLLLLLCTAVASAASASAGDSVRAFLDRNQAQLGDTVTLNVKVSGTTDVSAPDLSALQPDFDVLGTSRNTSISIVNGQRTQSVLWAVSLRPRHVGMLSVPPLQVDGNSTSALTLTVTPAPIAAKGGPGDDVFIQVTLDTTTPYVGQQVGMTVRLFYAPNLTQGSLDQPHADGIDVHAVGKGTRYQVERGGRRYHVLEQRYALFPQHAGHITLDALHFQGSAMDADGFSAFMGNGRSVQARSAALSMQVRSRPAAAGKGAWLPARALSLDLQGLPVDGQVQVGEPVTVTLTERATGLPSDSLPQPQLPALDGVQMYPDQTTDSTTDDGEWLHGERVRKFAIVPQHAGTLHIPAIKLPWWNVVSDHAEVASIPAHDLTVVAAVGRPGSAQPATLGSTPTPAVARVTGAMGDNDHAREWASTVSPWRWIALVSLGWWMLAVIGVGIWWWRRRGGPGPTAPPARVDSTRRLRNAFLHTVRSGDVAAQVAALLAWARAERPGLRNLGELSAALDSPPQCAAIAALQRARYADAGPAPEPEPLAGAFANGLRWRDSPAADTSALPPLYPRRD